MINNADSLQKKILCDSEVKENKLLFDSAYELSFFAPEIAKDIKPGQFIEIQCSKGGRQLFRRPFGVYKVDRDAGIVSIFYAVVGKETESLSQVAKGEKLNIIGPLGNSFPSEKYKHPVLVGGGTGFGPLGFLAEHFLKEGKSPILFYGTNSDEFLDFFNENLSRTSGDQAVTLKMSTMDGSYGYQGTVIDMVKAYCDGEDFSKFDCMFTCGPQIVMRKAFEIAEKYGIPCYVSEETIMGCGFGVCLGCTIEVKTEDGIALKCACKDGPVFNGKELNWND